MSHVKTIRTIALLALSLAAVRGEGGQVYWNTFTLTPAYQTEGNYYSSLYTDDPIPVEGFHFGIPSTIFKYGSRVGSSFKNTHDLPMAINADWALVLFAEAGDTLDWNYFASATSAYDNHITLAYGDFSSLTIPELTGESSARYFEPFYMAMMYWYQDQNGTKPGYAWFELQATYDGLEMLQSATTLDEGLIVSTGQFAGVTPEPTSGMLLLVGSALLLIRRRTR